MESAKNEMNNSKQKEESIHISNHENSKSSEEKKEIDRQCHAPISFTSVNLILFVLGFLMMKGCSDMTRNYTRTRSLSKHILCLSSCLSTGILLSFHSSLYFDKTSFQRIACKHKLQSNQRLFHLANFATHILPFLILHKMNKNSSLHTKPIHGKVAFLIHFLWSYIATRGTFCLDHVYVPMSQVAWKYLFLIAYVTEIAYPYLSKRRIL